MKQQEVNFFKHFNNVFRMMDNDERIQAKHVTMYLALFRRWNQLMFPKRFIVNRSEFLIKFKRKSKGVYANTLKELHDFGYINYQRNNGSRSVVEPFDFSSVGSDFLLVNPKAEQGSSVPEKTSLENTTGPVTKSGHLIEVDSLEEYKGDVIIPTSSSKNQFLEAFNVNPKAC